MIYTFTDHGKLQLSVRAERLFVRLCDKIMGGTKTTPFGFLHSAGKKPSGNPAALIIQGNSDPGKFNGRNEFFRPAVQDIGLRIGVEGDHSGEIMPVVVFKQNREFLARSKRIVSADG